MSQTDHSRNRTLWRRLRLLRAERALLTAERGALIGWLREGREGLEGAVAHAKETRMESGRLIRLAASRTPLAGQIA